MKRIFAVLGLLLLLANCASTPPPNTPFVAAASAPAGHANLYIYRRQAPPYIYKTEIMVDGELKVKLPEPGYSVIPLSLGEHTIAVKSFDWPDVSFKLNVEDSSDIFVKFTGSAHASMAGGLRIVTTSVAEVYVVDAPEAKAEIAVCCRLIPLDQPSR